MSFRYREEPRFAMSFTGDGASSAGLFHETLNLASVFNAPWVCIVENNLYAYSTPVAEQMKITDIARRADGYGIPGVIVDGNDVEAVYAVVHEAIERARRGGGPTLIEAKTMRMLGHAIHDGAEYVPPELLAEWEAEDPLRRFEARLIADGRHRPGRAGRNRPALRGGGGGRRRLCRGQPVARAGDGYGGRVCGVMRETCCVVRGA